VKLGSQGQDMGGNFSTHADEDEHTGSLSSRLILTFRRTPQPQEFFTVAATTYDSVFSSVKMNYFKTDQWRDRAAPRPLTIGASVGEGELPARAPPSGKSMREPPAK